MKKSPQTHVQCHPKKKVEKSQLLICPVGISGPISRMRGAIFFRVWQNTFGSLKLVGGRGLMGGGNLAGKGLPRARKFFLVKVAAKNVRQSQVFLEKRRNFDYTFGPARVGRQFVLEWTEGKNEREHETPRKKKILSGAALKARPARLQGQANESKSCVKRLPSFGEKPSCPVKKNFRDYYNYGPQSPQPK